MSPAEYKRLDIKTAWLEGRVIQDNAPKPITAKPDSAVIVAEGGAPGTPEWVKRNNRELEAKQAAEQAER
jgi:hypothetical protein